MSNEPHSEALVVELPTWHESDVALLCGIANAGGGSVLVGTSKKDYNSGMRRMRKVFETIPTKTLHELGIVCVTEPIMEGSALYLSITIPRPSAPVSYRGKHYLYADGNNRIVTQEVAEASLKAAEDPSAGTVHQSAEEPAETDLKTPPENGTASKKALRSPSNLSRGAVFADRSFAAMNDMDLTSTDEYVLRILNTNGRATAIQIAEVLGVSESTIRRSFRKLRTHGIITRIGSDKAGYWKVTL